MNELSAMPNQKQLKRYCVLEYSAEGERKATSSPVIIAALDEECNLSIFFDPDWRKYVCSRDQPYFESLLKDFAVRSKSDSRRLFEQLSSLSVGPLVAVDYLKPALSAESLADALKTLTKLNSRVAI